MIYFRSNSGKIFAYDTEDARHKFGTDDLVEMTHQEVTEHLASSGLAVSVPSSVTMRQARLALHAAGLLDQVEAAIEALPEPNRTVARIEWDYASEVHRASEFVTLLGAELELDKQSIDELFLKAREL